MNEPLVTVIIPAYNHSGYLAEAVKSVLDQDYTQLELIVINDGSTDSTAEVLASLGLGFYWESQENMGQSRTLARGWEMARGEILGYLSADDVLESGAVRAAVAALRIDPDVVATYCDFKLIDPNSRSVRRVKAADFSFESMLSRVRCPVGPGAFFRRAAYLRAGPWNPDYRQMPDYDFWLRLALHGRFIRLPQVLAGFRVHEGSQTYSQTTPERADEPVRIVTNVLNDSAINAFGADLKRRAMASAHLVSAQLHLRAGRVKEAVDHIRIAKKYSLIAVLAPHNLRILFNAVFNRLAHRFLWAMRTYLRKGSEQ
jgi:glycosyltransferase involved in cell wall biosynthesis